MGQLPTYSIKAHSSPEVPVRLRAVLLLPLPALVLRGPSLSAGGFGVNVL